MEGDEFQDLNLRASGGPAVGYQFFEGKPTSLAVEVGPTYVHEDYDTQEDNNFFSSRWYIGFSHWFFDELFQYYLRNLGFQSLEDKQDTVIKLWTGLRFPLVAGFVATGEYVWDWDNNPAPGNDKTDTEYRLKLGYHW
jgi:putative salt-induced outer membrane protein YdiY